MDPDQLHPASLVGSFVTEIGIRQAWPYLTLACNDDMAVPPEVRLYIGTDFTVQPPPPRPSTRTEDAEIRLWLLLLAEVLNLTVEAATIEPDSSLSLAFAGDVTLTISGQGTEWTSGDIWWFGRA
ncbi:hypothetical protein [Nocardia exalbida]|uniref:hypothetical protein n=1 Tax=Nocardia exalbida TaxID=290231 RepID=UPI0005938494|nr:hypothetical protein [Nocardia exalbida]